MSVMPKSKLSVMPHWTVLCYFPWNIKYKFPEGGICSCLSQTCPPHNWTSTKPVTICVLNSTMSNTSLRACSRCCNNRSVALTYTPTYRNVMYSHWWNLKGNFITLSKRRWLTTRHHLCDGNIKCLGAHFYSYLAIKIQRGILEWENHQSNKKKTCCEMPDFQNHVNIPAALICWESNGKN